MYLDLRHERIDPPTPPINRKYRLSGGKILRRNPKDIDSIVIHQTGVQFGLAPFQIQRAQGVLRARGDNPTPEEVRNYAFGCRAMDVACHAMAFRSGLVVITNDPVSYVHHGNGLNARSVGLEIDGLYPGVKGGRTWNGQDASVLTPLTIYTAREALRHLLTLSEHAGCPIQYIYAHRQSSATRETDPGEEIWKAVVLEYAVPVLKLKIDPNLSIGDGRPIPPSWSF